MREIHSLSNLINGTAILEDLVSVNESELKRELLACSFSKKATSSFRTRHLRTRIKRANENTSQTIVITRRSRQMV